MLSVKSSIRRVREELFGEFTADLMSLTEVEGVDFEWQ